MKLLAQLTHNYLPDNNLIYKVIVGIYSWLKTASHKHLIFGCIQALHKVNWDRRIEDVREEFGYRSFPTIEKVMKKII